MACLTHCCVLTRGEFFITDWKSDCLDGIPGINCDGLTGAFSKVGNVSSALVNISSSVIGKENKFNPMTDVCSRVMIEGVTLDITFSCASSSNLYRALYAAKEIDFPNTVTKDFCIDELKECLFYPFPKKGVNEQSLVVTILETDGDVVKTLIVDEDYSISKSGIELLRDIDKETGSVLRISYTYDPSGYHEFDFRTQFMGYKSVYFKGVNFNDESQDLFDCVFHKVLFTPMNQFDLISRDEFFTITLSGSVELDKAQNSWFKITKQES